MQESKDKKTYLTVPNRGDFELSYLLESIDYVRQVSWIHESWKSTPALIDKGGGSSRQYVGQKFDPKHFDLVENGWTHDHCEICFHTISDIEGYGDPDGYKAENGDWICNNCYNLFVNPVDVQETINSLPSSLK